MGIKEETFKNMQRENGAMKKSLLVVGWWLVLLFSCTKTEEILVPGEKEIIIKDSSALKQIFNTSYSDRIFSADIRGDSVFAFVTRRGFSYDGEYAINVAAARSIAVWHIINGEEILVGTSRGYVASSESNSEIVALLLPGQGYSYIVIWDRGPFLITNAFFTNFYADIEFPGLSKGVSVKKAIERWENEEFVKNNFLM